MRGARIASIITYILMAVGIVFLVLVIYHGDEAIETSGEIQSQVVDPFITIGVYTVIITAAIAILLSIIQLFRNFSNAINALIGLVFLAVVFIVAYFMADGGDYTSYLTDEISVTEETSRLVGMGLNALYIIMGCTILSIVYVEISRAFKS